jgi:hypothetical protein
MQEASAYAERAFYIIEHSVCDAKLLEGKIRLQFPKTFFENPVLVPFDDFGRRSTALSLSLLHPAQSGAMMKTVQLSVASFLREERCQVAFGQNRRCL